jgi:hypothetical protein
MALEGVFSLVKGRLERRFRLETFDQEITSWVVELAENPMSMLFRGEYIEDSKPSEPRLDSGLHSGVPKTSFSSI